TPDPRLRLWEQLRRCPWAFRLVKGAHPLGIPPWHFIRQPVLASDIFRSTKREAIEWFHDPDKLGELCRHEHVRRRKTFIKQDFSVTTREMELFEQRAPEIFRQIIGAAPQAHHTASPGADYPKFAGFEAPRPASNATSTMVPEITNRRRSARATGVGFCCKGCTPSTLMEFRSTPPLTQSLIGS